MVYGHISAFLRLKCSLIAYSLRRWSNIKPALGQHIVFVGLTSCFRTQTASIACVMYILFITISREGSIKKNAERDGNPVKVLSVSAPETWLIGPKYSRDITKSEIGVQNVLKPVLVHESCNKIMFPHRKVKHAKINGLVFIV